MPVASSVARVLLTVVGAAISAVQNISLNNGMLMPLIALGTKQLGSQTDVVVKLALEQGISHIDTAQSYGNQDVVAKVLAEFPRDSYFITSKIFGIDDAKKAYRQTTQKLKQNLRKLHMSTVNLMLLEWPADNCAAIQENWRAFEDFYFAGKALSIGVSNFCISTFECLLGTAKVVPAVNQMQLHIGMGKDPGGLTSYLQKHFTVPQAYSPLAGGDPELISGDVVTRLGLKHHKTGAQVSMRWNIDHKVALATSTTKITHMMEDIDIFTFALTEDDRSTLNDLTSPAGQPSSKCTSAQALSV